MADYDLVIVGGGPGGMTAGIYGQRAGLKTLVLESQICGGQIAMAPEVENYPGIPKTMGIDLSDKIKDHAQDIVEIKEMVEVQSAEMGDPITLQTTEGEITTKAVILATGAKHRTLGLETEFKLSGRGISYCGVCDGNFFLGKRVCVIGGGNSSLMDAIYLKNIGCKVTVIHRRDEFRADEVYVEQAKCIGIDFILDSTPIEFNGQEKLESVSLKNLKTNEVDEVPFEGAFICIGVDPNIKLAKDLGVELDEHNYVITDKNQRTNQKLVYACGDVAGGIKQAIVACGEAAVAALIAYEDIRNPYWCEIRK